ELSKKSMLIHPSDFSPNLSTLTNIPVVIPKQKDPVTPYKVVPNVHTVCFVMSDGDNVQWLSGASDNTNTWANPNRARLNLGWTISPALVELAPVMYKKYIENCLTSCEGRNYLVAAPSGIGYHFPGIFPDLANECDLLNRFMKKADLNIVNIIDVDNGAHNPTEYLRQSNIDALFYYTYGANYTGMNGKISWYKNKPSIGGRYTLWGTLSAPDALADKLNISSTNINSEAGYSLIPVHVWSRNVTDVMECIKLLHPNVRVVAPDEFVWLIRKNIKGINLGNGNGLKGEYFKDSNSDSLIYSQNDSKIDFDWGTSSPNETTLGADSFSVHWTGQIQAVYSEKYTFKLSVTGGAKLSINGNVLVDSLDSKAAKTFSDTISLVSGQKYDIVLEYRKNDTNAGCNLQWESTSQLLQTVPRTQLYCRALPTTDVVTAYSDCNYEGFSGGLKVGDYNLDALNQLGIYEKDIASIKVPIGYKVVLYEDDNFSGESVEITADSACLNDWNDRTTSLKVKTNGDTSLNGVFFLKNRLANFNMQVAGGYQATDDGANIQLYSMTQNTDEQFKFTHLGDGNYNISPMNSGKSLDVEEFSMNDGANVQQWSNYNSSNQQFIAVPTGDGYYKLIARHSGKILDISSFTSMSNIRQWTDNNQTKGQWKLNPVPPLINAEGTGLSADYYNGQNFNTLRYSTVDSTINFDWGTSAPYSKTTVDNFSVRWEGQIQPRFSGNFFFYVNSDNGRRLWVNDQLIIDQWVSDYGIEYSGSINLIANQKCNIKLEYFEDAGGANCKLEWMSNLQPREIVPKSQLNTVLSGLNDLEADNNIKIYPNPIANKLMNVQINGSDSDIENTLVIYDLVGKPVFTTKIYHSCNVDIKSVPSGAYILSIKNKYNSINKQVLVK
ncbi:MAG: PA14 domain-containing protein, partial [Paludibacter sp.]